MEFNETEVTWLGIVVSWFLAFFGFGRVWGMISTRVKKNEEDIEELQQMFKTQDGEPRLMSFSAHDQIQAACHKRMDERQENINGRLSSHDKKLDKIIDGLAELRGKKKS